MYMHIYPTHIILLLDNFVVWRSTMHNNIIAILLPKAFYTYMNILMCMLGQYRIKGAVKAALTAFKMTVWIFDLYAHPSKADSEKLLKTFNW